MNNRTTIVLKDELLNEKVKSAESSLKTKSSLNYYLKAEFYTDNNLTEKAIKNY